jgi:hypothetical protein
MTAVPNDFVRLEGPAGAVDLNCIEYGIGWPPPETITHVGDTQLEVPQVLMQHSDVSDVDAFADPTLARGALYWPANAIDPGEHDA